MTDNDHAPESIAVGADETASRPDPKDVVPPIHLSTTFGLEAAGYPEEGYTYTRHGNPTRAALEDRLGGLSGADHVLTTASGMAAIATVCLSLLGDGDTLVASDALYGGTTTLFDELLPRFGVEVRTVDATDADEVAGSLDPSVAAVWVESPTNPLLKICDLPALGDLADDHGATLVVDNTFASPAAQRPLELGADVSMYSTTKFVNGHTDSLGGAIATDESALAEECEFVLEDLLGAPMAPFDAYLVRRGVMTLPARMAVHERNATAVAEFLDGHESVATVNYPGLEIHPRHDLAASQMETFGGVLSFELDADGAETRAFVEDLDVCNLAMSLGGVETLVEHTASMSGATLSAAQRAEAGISDSLVRLSVGLEAPEDLIDDLAASLAKV